MCEPGGTGGMALARGAEVGVDHMLVISSGQRMEVGAGHHVISSGQRREVRAGRHVISSGNLGLDVMCALPGVRRFPHAVL